MLCLICHITLGWFFLLFGVDTSVAVISARCFLQACSWSKPVISVQPVPPSMAASPMWRRWQRPQHRHVVPWTCLFCLRPCAARSAWHGSGGKHQARQSCRYQPPPTHLGASRQPWDTCYAKPGRGRRKAALLEFLVLFPPKSPMHRSREFPSRDTALSPAQRTRHFLK